MGETRQSFRVADLFCGPGGISEGLRLGGAEIVYGMDRNKDALRTFQHNHPNAMTLQADATNLDPETIPEFDLMVGGPPCVNFSQSKGSRANVLEGLRLVQVFLRVVYERKPKYWIMENVPRIAMHLPEAIPLSWIGIDREGELDVPVRHEFNCADYGVSQNRRRYLIGRYPVPEETHHNPNGDTLFSWSRGVPAWSSLGSVLEALPNPEEKPRGSSKTSDPNYGLTMPSIELCDHFHPVVLSADESRRIRKAKNEHPYMGFMPFPDELDRPARTVVATQLGRETLVIEGKRKNGKPSHRRATVRECATIQTFPINYNFHGASLSSRYKQAGDAVPPMLTRAIMVEILKREGISHVVSSQQLDKGAPPPPAQVNTRKLGKSIQPLDKRFREMVPGKEVRGCRVDFDNQGSSPTRARFCSAKALNIVEWVSRLHVGEGKDNRRERLLSLNDTLIMMSAYADRCDTKEKEKCIEFVSVLFESLLDVVPDASTLQAVYTNRHQGGRHPSQIVEVISKEVNKFFPKTPCADIRIHVQEQFPELPNNGLRLRIAAGALGSAIACELANCDSRWLEKNLDKRFLPEHWNSRTVNVRKKERIIENPSEVYRLMLEQTPEVALLS